MNSLGRKNKDKANKSSVFTTETFGVVLILFSALCLVCLITRDAVFSLPGLYVNSFLLGLFGYFAYPVFLWLITMGALIVAGKKTGLSKKRKILFTLIAVLIAVLVHCITMHGKNLSYGAYLAESYNMGAGGIATSSGGGIVIGLVAYIFSVLAAGGYVILGVLTVLAVYAVVIDYRGKAKPAKEGTEKFRGSFIKESDFEEMASLPDGGAVEEREYPVQGVEFNHGAQKNLFVSNADDFAFKSKRDLKKEENKAGIKLGFGEKGLGVGNAQTGYSADYADDMEKKLKYIKTPAAIDYTAAFQTKPAAPADSGGVNVSKPMARTASAAAPQAEPRSASDKPKAEEPVKPIPMFEHDESANSAAGRAAAFSGRYASIEETETVADKAVSAPEQIFRPVERAETASPAIGKEKASETGSAPNVKEEIFSEISEEKSEPQAVQPVVEDKPADSPIVRDRRARGILFGENTSEKTAAGESTQFGGRTGGENVSGMRRSRFEEELHAPEPATAAAVPEKPPKEIPPINREYFRPPYDLLETYAPPTDVPKENHEERMEIIQRTLEQFHINAVPQSYVQGPSITRYEITMPAGISVKKVLNYDDDLKMRLAAKDGVRIEAPIPGKDLVGIEVANRVKVTVGLKQVLEGLAGKKFKSDSLMFAIGQDLVGNSVCDNLAKGPHYLVAGATGSGKSVCLNVMIVSLIMRYSPEELRLILVDPKRVEFRAYEHIPHLLIDEIITEPKKALAVLTWAYDEMERRYKVFEDCGGMVVDINAYNENVAGDTVPKMPKIVIIIDELADLMETCKKDLESRIRALAQKARSAGIHLVLATQRPSVDIITGTIKANLPSRIAFKVMNFNDSQTILGEQGAEKLLGNGDMLYKNSSMPEVERYQGAYISTREVNNVVSYIKEHNKAYFDDELAEYLENAVRPKQEEMSAAEDDRGENTENNEFFLRALALAVNSGTISISQLQRRFQIGYARAGGLVDKMERMGFISGNEGSKARKVLLTREGFEQRFGPMPSDEGY